MSQARRDSISMSVDGMEVSVISDEYFIFNTYLPFKSSCVQGQCRWKISQMFSFIFAFKRKYDSVFESNILGWWRRERWDKEKVEKPLREEKKRRIQQVNIFLIMMRQIFQEQSSSKFSIKTYKRKSQNVYTTFNF